MKQAKYDEIMEVVNTTPLKQCLSVLIKTFPECNNQTLGSIYQQEYQRKMKREHKTHYAVERMNEYYLWFVNARRTGAKQCLLNLAERLDMSPALLARIVLERHLVHNEFEGEPPPKGMVSALIKNTCLISDPTLATEVQLCMLTDDVYGPLVDSIKHSIGHEYEFILCRELKKRNIEYLDEDGLRAEGYDKTPDCKLEVPICVDGHVVNWIESKASFGDYESHSGYLKDQFWSYWNRFGPGLVIYWFGFIDELDCNRHKGIALIDHFPEDIIFMS